MKIYAFPKFLNMLTDSPASKLYRYLTIVSSSSLCLWLFCHNDTTSLPAFYLPFSRWTWISWFLVSPLLHLFCRRSSRNKWDWCFSCHLSNQINALDEAESTAQPGKHLPLAFVCKGLLVKGALENVSLKGTFHMELLIYSSIHCLQCFDAVGWVAGKTSSL